MKINKIVLGTVQMGLTYGVNNLNGKITKKESLLILKEGANLGVEFLDTAEAYGEAHSIIGDFHKKSEFKYKILTKFPHSFEASIEDKYEVYLKELNVEQLYGLSFHSFDSYKEYFTKNLDILKKLTQISGVKIGVSVYTNEEFENIIADPNVSIIQLPFNLLDNMNSRGDLLRKAKAKNKEIHVRSVFLQGLFFSNLESTTNPNVIALRDELKVLNCICNKYDLTMFQLALNYVAHNKFVDKVLIGIDSLQQLRENINSIMNDFPAEINADIEKIKISDVNLLNPTLWKTQK